MPPAAGHYESFYLKACHPDGGLGVWIRHTVHKTPGRDPVGSVWFVLFDAAADAPIASKVTVGSDHLTTGPDFLIQVGDARLTDDRASGSAVSHLAQPTWELEFASSAPAYRHLPKAWMYTAPVPRTKTLSPYPAATFRGTVLVGQRTVVLDGWPGMVGHNWGSEHAERWIWLQAGAFAGQPDAWFDAVIGRIKLGPMTLPWIANGRLHLDGEDLALGGPGRMRATRVEERPERCLFTLTGPGVTVEGQVGAARTDCVGWIYADPGGSEHNTVNCSIASLTLDIRRPGRTAQKLTCEGGAAYELGMRERDHGMPIQPFTDP